MKKRLLVLTILVIVAQLVMVVVPCQAQPAAPLIKELNFVFLHGACGYSYALQLLSDVIEEKLPDYIAAYEKQNPGIRIVTDSLNRSYPNAVDINTWAENIADGIKDHFHQNNLILIGHSMGGKTALYMTSHNIGGLTDSIAMVATINSPIKELSRYYFSGGVDYWQGQFLVKQDKGVLSSLAYYDSSDDGQWVGTNKHWLALVSAESSPISKQFDTSGVDPLPRNMDDTIVPVSAQYADGADVVYYGEHAHSDFTSEKIVASEVADNILDYVFGYKIDFSVLTDSGSFSHKAGLFPVNYTWNETTGEVPVDNGSFTYKNPSFTWQEYNVVVGGDVALEGRRGNFSTQVHSLPLISGLKEARWLNDDEYDARILLHIRAAPKTSVRIEWNIEGYEPKTKLQRNRYEVEIATGTPFTDIENAGWVGIQADDFRLQISSRAEGPQRWFDANWRTYAIETRSVGVIDTMPRLMEPMPMAPSPAPPVPLTN